MKVIVEMTAEEFQEFMQWKKDKGIYDAELNTVDGKIEHINNIFDVINGFIINTTINFYYYIFTFFSNFFNSS